MILLVRRISGIFATFDATFSREWHRLAAVPKPNQSALTALIEGVLKAWDGPLPRLAYVTDAGITETAYYRRVLRPNRPYLELPFFFRLQISP